MNASRLRTVYLLLLFVLVGVTAAAPLTRIEYAIDPPDLNNNWVIGSPLNSDSAAGTLNIPLSGLSNGLHVLLTRVVDSNNRKSIPVVKNLWVVRNNSTVVPYGEYFIDFDPGPTHGSEIIFRESDSVSVSFAVPVATQSPGFHVLGIRVNA
ncbi:MAG: hypothetical protein OEM52_14865, partial [bacterium]|nr:hypothetical protein [bacterium]